MHLISDIPGALNVRLRRDVFIIDIQMFLFSVIQDFSIYVLCDFKKD